MSELPIIDTVTLERKERFLRQYFSDLLEKIPNVFPDPISANEFSSQLGTLLKSNGFKEPNPDPMYLFDRRPSYIIETDRSDYLRNYKVWLDDIERIKTTTIPNTYTGRDFANIARRANSLVKNSEEIRRFLYLRGITIITVKLRELFIENSSILQNGGICDPTILWLIVDFMEQFFDLNSRLVDDRLPTQGIYNQRVIRMQLTRLVKYSNRQFVEICQADIDSPAPITINRYSAFDEALQSLTSGTKGFPQIPFYEDYTITSDFAEELLEVYNRKWQASRKIVTTDED
jgi:hypothetical protein